MHRFIRFALVGLVVFCSVACTGFRTFKLPTEGMAPSLERGDWFIAVPTDKVKRGDIIVFRYPKDPSVWYVFRVVGLPNETVEVRANAVYIDGKLLEESYVSQKNNVANLKPGTYAVGSDSYFVMGDNRDNSADSRFWGNVQSELIYGTFYMKYFHTEPADN